MGFVSMQSQNLRSPALAGRSMASRFRPQLHEVICPLLDAASGKTEGGNAVNGWLFRWWKPDFEYCPHCGAKMEEAEHDTRL